MGAPSPIPWHTLSVLLRHLLPCKALKSAGGRAASLVVQWVRIHLLTQETQVQSLVWEDPTCRGATKPVLLNLRVSTLEPVLCNEKPAHCIEE